MWGEPGAGGPVTEGDRKTLPLAADDDKLAILVECCFAAEPWRA